MFVISVAAELSGLHPQTLRYVRPARPSSRPDAPAAAAAATRCATSSCCVRSRDCTAEGLGLEGVRRVIELEHQVLAPQEKVAELQAELAQSRLRAEPRRT